MRGILIAAALLAGCQARPDACELKLISMDEAADTETTKAEIRAHNERLRQMCPTIQYQLKK
jgi:hypothetical protein